MKCSKQTMLYDLKHDIAYELFRLVSAMLTLELIRRQQRPNSEIAAAIWKIPYIFTLFRHVAFFIAFVICLGFHSNMADTWEKPIVDLYINLIFNACI